MIFKEVELKGAYIIEPEKLEDKRGFFARVWDREIFLNLGLNTNLVQCNISFNKSKGTVRGLHFQIKPYEETKVVRCTKGSVFEVLVDIRKNSKTFKKWLGVKLSAENHKLLYVPKGFALGFQTLEDNSELFYQMSQIYKPEYAKGIRWDDQTFNISWPERVTIISDRDQSFPKFDESMAL
jgi:dTDP-4-dehydrorhamnose 3,5-epimerase